MSQHLAVLGVKGGTKLSIDSFLYLSYYLKSAQFLSIHFRISIPYANHAVKVKKAIAREINYRLIDQLLWFFKRAPLYCQNI